MATDPLSNFKSSPFVGQYKGLPIDAFQQSATVLQNRAVQNQDTLDKLDMMAYNISVSDVDENVKQSRMKAIRDEQERISGSGAYEMATDLVRKQSKDFMQDTALNTATSNYKNMTAGMAESQKYSPQQQAAFKMRLANYKGVGEGNEMGQYNTFGPASFYEDIDFNEKIDKFVDDWKANESEWVSNAQKAGYITSGGTKKVTEQEVRDASLRMLQSDPTYRRALEDEARYKLYELTGDINSMAADPNTVIGTRGDENVTALQAAMEDYVEPYAQRESFKATSAGMKTDANFGLKMKMQQEFAGRSVVQGSAINPYEKLTSENWRQTTANQQAQLKSLKDQLSTVDPTANPAQYGALQRQIDAVESQNKTFEQIKKEYRENLADISPEDAQALAFSEKTQGINLARQGDYFFNEPEKAKQVLDAYKEVYGQEAYDALGVTKKTRRNMVTGEEFEIDVVTNLTPLLSTNAKGRRLEDKTYFSDNDFNDYLESQSERFGETPTVILFNQDSKSDQELITDSRSIITAGNIKVSSSTSSDDPDVRNFLTAIADQLIVSGLDAQDGRINVNVPQIDLDASKYDNLSDDVKDAGRELMKSGKNNLYVTPLGSDYKTKFISNLKREAEMQASLGNDYEYNQAMQLIGTFNQQLDANNWDPQISAAVAQPDIKQNIVAGDADISIQVSPIDNSMFMVYDNNGKIITAKDSNKPLLFSRGDVDLYINKVNLVNK